MKEKIKKLFKNLSKYLGELILIIGVGIFIHNVLNLIKSFSIKISNYAVKEGSLSLPSLRGLPGRESNLISEKVYNFSFGHYSNEIILFITIGAMLIIGGLLIIKHKTK